MRKRIRISKLRISKETLRQLNDSSFQKVIGGVIPSDNGNECDTTQGPGFSCEQYSICVCWTFTNCC